MTTDERGGYSGLAREFLRLARFFGGDVSEEQDGVGELGRGRVDRAEGRDSGFAAFDLVVGWRAYVSGERKDQVDQVKHGWRGPMPLAA
jgi:hypothetical protein